MRDIDFNVEEDEEMRIDGKKKLKPKSSRGRNGQGNKHIEATGRCPANVASKSCCGEAEKKTDERTTEKRKLFLQKTNN